jgi:gentisate 1,2-dioxygenase
VQPVTASERERVYARGGLLPAPVFERMRGRDYPMLRYPWREARAALLDLAATQPDIDAVQVAYVNPETGVDCQNILGYAALMLRPGETLALPARSPAMVFHLIEGAATVEVDANAFMLDPADTCCAPGCTPVTLRNRSRTEPAFVFIADESPLHRKLGVYEVGAPAR